MQDIHRKNAKKLTVNPPDMSNKSNLEDFPLILYEAANDECKFLCKLICMQIMDLLWLYIGANILPRDKRVTFVVHHHS